jgi:hypothetical protein
MAWREVEGAFCRANVTHLGQPHTGIADLQVVQVAVPEPSPLVLFGVAATSVAILIGGLRSR